MFNKKEIKNINDNIESLKDQVELLTTWIRESILENRKFNENLKIPEKITNEKIITKVVYTKDAKKLINEMKDDLKKTHKGYYCTGPRCVQEELTFIKNIDKWKKIFDLDS